MNRCASVLCVLWFVTAGAKAQVGISTTSITPHPSAVLELRSTNTGFLPPRMTTTERDAISSPANGLLIYNTTTSQLNYYTGTAWQAVINSGTFTSSTPGLVPASGGGTDKFLRADGTFQIPNSGLGALTTSTSDIGNAETKVTSYTIPANTLQTGTSFRVTVFGTFTTTSTTTSNFRVRIGTSGTSSDVLAAVVAPVSHNSGTAVPFTVSITVTIRTTGASGTLAGNGVLTNFADATGIEKDGMAVGVPVVGAAVNTTVANQIHLSYQSGHTNARAAFQIATIELVN